MNSICYILQVFQPSKEENKSDLRANPQSIKTDVQQNKNLNKNVLMKRTAPEAARSAFMCFSLHRKKNRKENDPNMEAENVFAYFSNEWKKMSNQERSSWEEEARKDKLRFAKEKANLSGGWDITKRRAKKNPLAPKRPMSAFLKFSKTRRKIVKEENPHICNTDVSRLLGEMWRNADPSERHPYIEEEARERIIYKAKIAKFRSEQAKREAFRTKINPEDYSFPVKNVEIDSRQQYQYDNEYRSIPPPFNGERMYDRSNSFVPEMQDPVQTQTYHYTHPVSSSPYSPQSQRGVYFI